MSLSAYGRSALRNWYLLILCGLAAGGAALAVTLSQQEEYRSSLRLAVGPSPTITRSTLVAETIDALNKRPLITTMAEIVGGRTIRADAAQAISLSPESASRYHVSSVAMPDANVISLEVQGPDRSVAAALAQDIAAKSTQSIEHLYVNFAVQALDSPSTPGDPVSPKPKRDVPLAVAGGLCLGFLLGLCRDYLVRRRRGDGAVVATAT